jgi:hypothetical protein
MVMPVSAKVRRSSSVNESGTVFVTRRTTRLLCSRYSTPTTVDGTLWLLCPSNCRADGSMWATTSIEAVGGAGGTVRRIGRTGMSKSEWSRHARDRTPRSQQTKRLRCLVTRTRSIA